MATWQGIGGVAVAEKYEITESRCVVERGKPERVRRYDPWEFPEIVSALANIQPGEDASVLSFVHQWGPLGAYTAHPDHFGWIEEPVYWLEQHAAAVRASLQLIGLIYDRDSSGVDNYLSESWPEVSSYISRILLHSQKEALQQASRFAGLQAAGHILAALVNHRIDRLYPKYLLLDDGRPRRVYMTDTLLEVIYCHVGAAWENRAGYYQCANRHCRRWWPYNDTPGPKRKFCPPESGGESLCSRQERYYRSIDRSDAS